MATNSIPALVLDEVRGWADDRELRGRWIRDGVRLWLLAAGTSFALALIVTLVLVSQLPTGAISLAQSPLV